MSMVRHTIQAWMRLRTARMMMRISVRADAAPAFGERAREIQDVGHDHCAPFESPLVGSGPKPGMVPSESDQSNTT